MYNGWMPRGSRGPVTSIGGIGRVDRSMSVARIQALSPLASSARVVPVSGGYTFKQALDRCQRGMVRADPLPTPVKTRPPLPPDPDDMEPIVDELPASTFLARLLKRR